MERQSEYPRGDWQQIVEQQGLIFHHADAGAYWDESASYRLTAAQVDELEKATNELQARCLEAGQHIIDRNLFDRLGIPEAAVSAIVRSWNEEPPAIYGRFDLVYDGVHPPKLLEYNADTPTSLIESAVVQWFWKQDVHPGTDQFNSIHERLVAKWKELRGDLTGDRLYFAAVPDRQAEDLMTVSYLRETAMQAGLTTMPITMEEIGWDTDDKVFRAPDGEPIRSIVKLYPWEWMVREPFGGFAIESDLQWIEPVWKMLWSNKALLAVLWELFPEHPNLVPAYLDAPRDLRRYVRKPKMSREGANITIVDRGRTLLETGGDCGEEGFVYQAIAPPSDFAGNHPVMGVWIINHEAAGLGIREDTRRITGNLSRFVPHFFR